MTSTSQDFALKVIVGIVFWVLHLPLLLLSVVLVLKRPIFVCIFAYVVFHFITKFW